MKFRSITTLFAFLLCLSLSAQSTAERAGERAKNRAESRANSKVDQKIDGAVDDAFNAVGNLFKKKKKKKKKGSGAAEAPNGTPSQRTTGGGLFGGGKWEPFTNPVSFSLRMEMSEEKRNGKVENINMNMAATTDQFAFRIEDEEAKEVNRMILNTDDGYTTIVSTDKKGAKSAVRMRLPNLKQVTAEAVEETIENITIEETDEWETIEGFKCRKYIVTDEANGVTTESWVTQEAGLNVRDVYLGMMNAFGAQGPKQQGGPSAAMAGQYEGFPILSISNDGKSTYTVRYKNIKAGADNMDKSILDLTGIPVQSVGF